MHTSARNRAIVWVFLATALLVNIAGYAWNLYDRFEWFDEVLHAYTTFALTLPIVLLLYDVTLKGAQTHPVLFVLTAASLGVSIGVLWEIVEWAYDQMVPENAILGKLDTIIDLAMDILGSVIAGVASVRMVKTEQ
jgi:VanZ family protein